LDALAKPKFEDIEAAEKRLLGRVRQTPILESSRLNDKLNCRLFIKAECLQSTGSFKFRGALNKVMQIPKDRRYKGVVAYSSGNHAQGVAAAAQIFGIPAKIVMPSDAPQIKIQNTRNFGAKVVLYDRKKANRVEVANRIIEETGGLMIPPYDDPDIIAGQGTIALELLRQVKHRNVDLDMMLGPSSGGGMMSGCALVLKNHNPGINLYCVEPENYDDIALSLEIGKRIKIRPKTPSLCDALLLETPGELTFQILSDMRVSGLAVSEEAVLYAMRVAFEEFKVVLEPSGAIALGAVLMRKICCKGKNLAVICTGGNVDPHVFQKVLI